MIRYFCLMLFWLGCITCSNTLCAQAPFQSGDNVEVNVGEDWLPGIVKDASNSSEIQVEFEDPFFGKTVKGFSPSKCRLPDLSADGTRTWTSSNGKFKIRAKLKAVEGDQVRLVKENGEEVVVPLNKLSDVDRRFAKPKTTGQPTSQDSSDPVDDEFAGMSWNEKRRVLVEKMRQADSNDERRRLSKLMREHLADRSGQESSDFGARSNRSQRSRGNSGFGGSSGGRTEWRGGGRGRPAANNGSSSTSLPEPPSNRSRESIPINAFSSDFDEEAEIDKAIENSGFDAAMKDRIAEARRRSNASPGFGGGGGENRRMREEQKQKMGRQQDELRERMNARRGPANSRKSYSYPDFGVKFEIPNEYFEQEVAGTLHRFFDREAVRGVPNMIDVKRLSREVPHDVTLSRSNFEIPPLATSSNFSKMDWNGMKINVVRLTDENQLGEFVTFNVVIPIPERSFQVSFGGPLNREREVKRTLEWVMERFVCTKEISTTQSAKLFGGERSRRLIWGVVKLAAFLAGAGLLAGLVLARTTGKKKKKKLRRSPRRY